MKIKFNGIEYDVTADKTSLTNNILLKLDEKAVQLDDEDRTLYKSFAEKITDLISQDVKTVDITNDVNNLKNELEGLPSEELHEVIANLLLELSKLPHNNNEAPNNPNGPTTPPNNPNGPTTPPNNYTQDDNKITTAANKVVNALIQKTHADKIMCQFSAAMRREKLKSEQEKKEGEIQKKQELKLKEFEETQKKELKEFKENKDNKDNAEKIQGFQKEQELKLKEFKDTGTTEFKEFKESCEKERSELEEQIKQEMTNINEKVIEEINSYFTGEKRNIQTKEIKEIKTSKDLKDKLAYSKGLKQSLKLYDSIKDNGLSAVELKQYNAITTEINEYAQVLEKVSMELIGQAMQEIA